MNMADWLKEQFQQQQQQFRQFQGQEEEEHYRFAIHSEEVPLLPKQIEQALSTIFNDLPSKARPLLMCMSMFPDGYMFKKDRLISKWLSEGIADWEEAEFYFSQLVHMNVINCLQPNSKRNPDQAEACQWHVNHFMQQFLASKSADMGFVFTSTTLNLAAASAIGHDNETKTMPRKLALHHPDPNIPSLLQTIDLSQTRSLAVSGAVSGIPLDKFVNLVVLDLEGWENLQDEDLLRICRSKLFFLEYLSIRNTRVSKLPPEIKELRLVATLDVSYTQISELPFELFELRCLYKLDLRGTRIKQLPKQIVRLQHLHHLLLGGEGIIEYSTKTAIMVPLDIRCMHNMKTLATIDLSEYPASFISAIGDLEYLLVLAITWSFHQCTDRSYSDALLSSIRKWKCLKSLTIHCGLGCYMEFLETLSDMPLHLESLKVTVGRFAGVPKWTQWLRFLSFVQITICVLDDLNILRDLPKLQCLILGLDFIPREAVVIEYGFYDLRRFSIDCPMPWLNFETEAMPKLTYLQLDFCAVPMGPTRVPSGITNLRRLQEVTLWYDEKCGNSCSIKMTVDSVKEEVARHSNLIDFFINGTKHDYVEAVDEEETENATGTPSGTNAGAGYEVEAVADVATGMVPVEITEAEI